MSEKDQLNIHEEIGLNIGKLVNTKNAAYGNSFSVCGDFLKILYPNGVLPEQYADMLTIVRMFDKMMRVATDKDALGEDPFSDLVGYGILAVANRKSKGESNVS